jgi:geranylgeranyl pyrophosphate synthase
MKAAGVELDMHIAALIAGGSEKKVGVLKEYGRSIGILATLREEFVDVFEGEELSRRVRDETLPLPLMFALHDPKLKVRIMKILKKKKIGSVDIDELARIVLDIEPVDKLKKRMEKLCRRAFILAHQTEHRRSEKLLRSLPQSMLEDI